MRQPRAVHYVYASTIVLVGALFLLRVLAPALAPDLPTENHPAFLFCGGIVIAGIAWFTTFLALRKSRDFHKSLLPILLLAGLGLRLMFFESQPVYENDYKRYLWDGAVTASGENPYRYSPEQVFAASQVGASSVPSLTRLAIMSNAADGLTGEINSPSLTTIYPPAAQGVFALAHRITPLEPWGLQLVFLMIECLGLLALLAGLRARGLPSLWSAIYWLNPVIILTTYNGIHMDVLLTAPLLAAIVAANRRPYVAAILLSVAAALKIWPLLLAPVFFRKWRKQPLIYISVAAIIAGLTLISLAPMLLALDEHAGLAAYSANWTNSSFLFPGFRDFLGLFTDNSDRLARYTVAAALTAFSLWLGFAREPSEKTLSAHLMLLAGVFVILSPTGYPWYFIWFLMFLPLAANHWSARGLALLTVGAAAYFARYKLGEAGHYNIFSTILVPLQFGIPLLLLAHDGWKARPHAQS
ncbi:MAG: hypothetical protein ABJN69_06520 [Hellea sp.]